MNRLQILKSALIGGASAMTLMQPAAAKVFDIPDGDLSTALIAYVKQSNLEVLYADDTVRGRRSRGARGDYSEIAALTQILKGTGLAVETTPSNALEIVRQKASPRPEVIRVAAAAPRAAAPSATIETVVVTAQKKSENIQNVPIAVTALSQAQLTERQIAGGPDLVKEVPNLTFSKTNFSGYNLEIRGIGTQAISVTTDPAVAVAFNGTPFIRNHFFEQEFYDLQDVEVLRGPQGTLYGRNATAGVVNVKSALPEDQYEAVLSADLGNFSNRRLEAMLNLPIVGDKLDLRFAGEWTKRDGYSFNETTNQPIDGRDLWSGRASLRWRPNSDVDINLVWEHFQENDDRLRSGKQLCKTDQPPASIGGLTVPIGDLNLNGSNGTGAIGDFISQGCKATSLYSPEAFQVPYGFSLPYALALGVAIEGAYVNDHLDPYSSTTQSTDLRVIESTINPHYRAKNDTVELNANYAVTSALTFTSQTGYNQDLLWSTEDYNRFDTSRGIFVTNPPLTTTLEDRYIRPDPAAGTNGIPLDAFLFCDPQLGCSDRLVGEDLSEEHAWQLSQEFRLSSNFSGPFNFNAGGNYLHYETEENYYVFINALTAYAKLGNATGAAPGHTGSTFDNSACLQGGNNFSYGYQAPNPLLGGGEPTEECTYIDPNSINSLNNEGHNYFLSQNPYTLNSYALFGETYFDIASDLKFTGGLRWTEDQKHFISIPSEVATAGYGYYVTGIVDQQWDKMTGRAALNWAPKLDFTDQTLVYSSYARGYKAGGANPPGAVFDTYGQGDVTFPIHPATFRPEFVNAYELGSKNTLLDGSLTLNGDIFYYDYKDYQISEIVDRTSINLNFNATVKGAELETSWEPLPGLKFAFAGGYESTRIADGQSAIDLMDRTAGMPGWMVYKPFPTQASNCILPVNVVEAFLELGAYGDTRSACGNAYTNLIDPVTQRGYIQNPSVGGAPGGTTYAIPAGYPGFDPLSVDPAAPPNVNGGLGLPPNNGEGFAKNLSGNQLPNAPHFTTSLTADYTIPVSDDWAATLHGDFYWQSQSFARVFNDRPYDKIHGYSNVNLSLILTGNNGWQVMGYVKNVFDTTAITGDFLNSDDSGLTTNIFLTDPRLYGVRVTKQLDENDGFWGSSYSGYDLFADLFADKDGGQPPLWIELGGQMEHVAGQGAVFAPAFLAANPQSSVLWEGTTPTEAEQPPTFSFGEEAKILYQPTGSDWILSAAVRFGRSGNTRHVQHQTKGLHYKYFHSGIPQDKPRTVAEFADTHASHSESHAILDFMAGKDVGLGIFGEQTSSTLNLGVRIAQFVSKSAFDLRARPEVQEKYFTYGPAKFLLSHFNTYHANGRASRSFHGVGPTLSWNGSVPFEGNEDGGGFSFDWGANGAVLFGRQSTHVQHHESAHYLPPGHFYNAGVGYTTVYNPPSKIRNTLRSVTVPNLGGFAGISYRYANAKISLGYRADFFFGAIDGGIDKRKSETLNMGGPFATISFGLGG